MNDIKDLVHTACQLDEDGHYKKSDQIYESLLSMQQNLEQFSHFSLG